MSETHTVETDIEVFKHKFQEDVYKVLQLQSEIAEIQEQLQNAIASAKGHSFSKGAIVQFDKLFTVKKISEVLELKEEENKRAVEELYTSVFPGNIFVHQEFYDVCLEVYPGMVIKFSDDLSMIEVDDVTGVK